MIEEQCSEWEIKERRAQRLREMQKQKKKQEMLRKAIRIGGPLLIVAVVALFLLDGKLFQKQGNETEKGKTEVIQSQNEETEEQSEEAVQTVAAEKLDKVSVISRAVYNNPLQESGKQAEEIIQARVPEEAKQLIRYSANTTPDTIMLGSEIISNHALLIDLDTDNILAKKAAESIIDPASMTKVLTVLVAAEHISPEDLDDTFTMTLEITDYSYVHDCSNAGFLENEVITVRDLFYGTILPSGGDAALGLATYVAGSHEAFVELMNEKLEELGLSETAHFTNCIGLYDEEHYCTIYDMAMIMEAALENELCREVMSAKTYTTSVTEQHPEGITISNWFLRRIEDKDTGGVVVCGKTGYVVQSGNCAVSYGVDHAGKEYVCVTADATSGWRCIYDHVALYKEFAKGEAPVAEE